MKFMSASGDPRLEWLARLDQVTPDEAEELRSAWKDYCEVIAELDEATAELEHLRTGTG